MIIRYTDGRSVEGVLLARDENRIRVALKDCDDVSEFVIVSGVWVSEDCEPVRVEFAWQTAKHVDVSEADCLCSRELAARLIQLLLSGEEAEIHDLPIPSFEAGHGHFGLVM